MVSHTFSDCAFLCFIYSNKWERFWNQKNDVFANTGRLRQCIPHEGILVLYSPQELDFMTVTVTGTLAKANQVHLHTWDLHHKVHDAFGHGVNQFASVWPCGTALQAWHNLVWEFWSAKWRLTMVKYESSNDLSRFQQGMSTCFQELMKVLCTHTMLMQHHFNHQDFGIISPSAKSKSTKTSTSKKTAKIFEQVTSLWNSDCLCAGDLFFQYCCCSWKDKALQEFRVHMFLFWWSTSGHHYQGHWWQSNNIIDHLAEIQQQVTNRPRITRNLLLLPKFKNTF